MQTMEFYNKVEKIIQKDLRYSSDAYEFINDAVLFTIQKHEQIDQPRHISGSELLDGVREFALREFGPMAYDVFCEWGIMDGLAVGNIVFNMIEQNILSRSNEDSIKDFQSAIDFKIAFCTPFLPQNDNSDKIPKIV